MGSLYKYLPEKYVDDFVRKGAILFRTLSYFRDYEDAQIRSDEFEGTKLYRPRTGLEITLSATQQKIVLPHTFESTAKDDDIFVFCLSTIYSEELAKQFQSTTCVEITDPLKLIAGIRSALSRRPSIKDKMLVYGEVNYYIPEEPSIVDWALPEKIAMSKLNFYAPQHEYRIAFSINDAFRVENTSLRLVPPGNRKLPRTNFHPEKLLKIGNLSKSCTVHRFA